MGLNKFIQKIPSSINPVVIGPVKKASNWVTKTAEGGDASGSGGSTSLGGGSAVSGEELYGQSIGQTGEQIQDIIKKRKANLDQTDPTSSYIRQAGNRQIRQARASGGASGRTTRGEEAQIRRAAESDIGAQLHENRLKSLGAYQDTVSNVAKNLATIQLGNQAINTASNIPNIPQKEGFMDDFSVICTELHRQGFMSDAVFEKDKKFGIALRRNTPEVYAGYRILAAPVVRLMQKSGKFSHLVSILGMPWANWMAGKDNFLGRNINKYGQKLCRFTWRIKEWAHGFRHEQSNT